MFDLWLVVVTVVSFAVMVVFAIFCDRLMGAKR
jgi:hypothetical protein